MTAPILNFIAGKNPILNIDYAILSAPVRHVFMMAVIWHLTNKKANPNIQILEVGSWVGASTLSWGQGLKLHNEAKGTITCVDAWKPFFDRETHRDEVYVKMEQALSTETAYQLYLHNISTLPDTITCQHLRGNSQTILPLLKEKAFDVIFIDGDHSYTAVNRDIRNAMPLVKDGGIICGDDLNLQLSQVDKNNTVKNAEADFVRDEKNNRNYHPGVTLAVGEIFGDVSVWGGFWAMQKKGDTWQKISLRGFPEYFPDHFPESANQKARDHLKDIEIA